MTCTCGIRIGGGDVEYGAFEFLTGQQSPRFVDPMPRGVGHRTGGGAEGVRPLWGPAGVTRDGAPTHGGRLRRRDVLGGGGGRVQQHRGRGGPAWASPRRQ